MNYFSPYLLKTYENQDDVPNLSVRCHEMLMEPIVKKDMSLVEGAIKDSNDIWISLAMLI